MAPANNVFLFGPFRLAAGERLLTRDDAPVALGARALDILIALVSTPNEVVSKNDLMSRVWSDVSVGENSLRFHMTNLRKALGDGKDGARYISTIAGRGYCFVAPVSQGQDERTATAETIAPFRYANLPNPLAELVDRQEDLKAIAEFLESTRFVTIVGVGGVGKTTVATALGYHVIDSFAGAVLFVDLSMLSDPTLVTATIASLLGLPVQSNDVTGNLVTYLRDRRFLLILDTCEHLIDSVASFASRLFRQLPRMHILATSREALQVDGERVYRLDPLACPPDNATFTADVARTFPATQLFVQRATASGASISFDDADAAIVVGICQKLDGVALAIELAARRVETYGLRQTAALLDQQLTLLWPGPRDAPPRQRTLQATLEWSFALLSDSERLILRRLAIFVGDFTLDAALAVTSSGDAEHGSVFGAIDGLIAKSMIAVRPTGAMMRYRLLDTTRAYVLATNLDDPEIAGLPARHAKYFLRWLEQNERGWLSLSTGLERASYITDINNVRAALEWCFSERGDAKLGIALAAAAAPVYVAMSLLPECGRWSQLAIGALDNETRGGPEEMQLQASFGVASMHMYGPSDAAHTALKRSMAIAETSGDVLSQVGLLGTLSMFCTRDGEFRLALDHAKRARAVASAGKDPEATALAQSALGRALHFVGDHGGARIELDNAYRHWSRAQQAYLGFDDRILVGLGLAREMWMQGHPDQATKQAIETIGFAEASNNAASLAVALAWAPDVFFWTGDLDSVETYADRLIAHARSHSLGPYLHIGYGYKGALAVHRGDAKSGIDMLRDCLVHCRAAHYEMRNTELKIHLAQGLVATDDLDDAISVLEDTISLADTNGDALFMPEVLRIRGRASLAAQNPDYDDAESWFAQSIELSRRQGARGWELRAAADLADMGARRGQPDRAYDLLQPVFAAFAEGFETADLKRAARLLHDLRG